LLVSEQLAYLQNKDLGFNKDNVMVIPIDGASLNNSLDPLKEELLKNLVIENVAISSSVPGAPIEPYTFRIEEDGQMKVTAHKILCVDYEYLGLMGIEFKMGRNFSREMSTDEYQGYIINEASARAYGFGNEPLGHKMAVVERGGLIRVGKVIGVVRDFNFGSLHNPIEPLAILLRTREPGWQRNLNIRIKPGKVGEAIGIVKKIWEEFSMNSPLEYSLLDEILGEHYRYEEKLGEIFGYFSMICIFISCLGLLGLSSYVAEQRTKEIGIRKVMGASVSDLVSLLSVDFIKLVVIANIFAWPIAYYGVTKWLEDYPYRIGIGILPFIIAGALALLITLLTVGYQAFKAASANAIDSLRYE
jgi:putative ABC transport system permease protein